MVVLTLLAAIGVWLDMPGKPESAGAVAMKIEPTIQNAPAQQVRAVVTASSPVRMVRHLKDSYDPLNAVCFSPATDQVVAAATGGDLIVWDINSGRTQTTLSNHDHTVRNLVSLGGSRIAAGDDDGKILIWDIARGEPVQRMDGHGDAILAMTLSPDRKWLVSGGRDQRVILWSLTDAKNRVLAEDLGRVSALAVSPDSQRIAAGTSNGVIYLIAAKTGKVQLRIDSQAGAIEALSFAPDGTTLASAGLSNEILVWRTSSARLLRKLRNPRGKPVYSLAFSRKGQLFAGDASGMITVWDVSDGRLADKYYRHRGRVSDLVFSADGKTLASVSADKTLGLWAVF
jgi:WD40 repeat protein